MEILLTIIHVLVCLFLIGIVLLQADKGDGLAGAFGGGTSSTIFGERGSETTIAKVTKACAIVFMITSLVLSVFVPRWTKASRSAASRVNSNANYPQIPLQSIPTEAPTTAPAAMPAIPVAVPEAAAPAPAEKAAEVKEAAPAEKAAEVKEAAPAEKAAEIPAANTAAPAQQATEAESAPTAPTAVAPVAPGEAVPAPAPAEVPAAK